MEPPTTEEGGLDIGSREIEFLEAATTTWKGMTMSVWIKSTKKWVWRPYSLHLIHHVSLLCRGSNCKNCYLPIQRKKLVVENKHLREKLTWLTKWRLINNSPLPQLIYRQERIEFSTPKSPNCSVYMTQAHLTYSFQSWEPWNSAVCIRVPTDGPSCLISGAIFLEKLVEPWGNVLGG